MNNLMIDIETLSTRCDAAILSIGAVFFDTETLELGETFLVNIKMESDKNYGRIDPETIKWWLKQSDIARIEVTQSTEHTLLSALCSLKRWITSKTDPKQLKVWANSPSFDLVILHNAYQRCDKNAPWEWHNERDVRTCIDIGKTELNRHETIKPNNRQHTALADAQYQAAMVLSVYDKRKEILCL